MSKEDKGVSSFWKGFGIGFIIAMLFSLVSHGIGYYTATGELK